MGIQCAPPKRSRERRKNPNETTCNSEVNTNNYQQTSHNFSNINSFNSYDEKPKYKNVYDNENNNNNQYNNNDSNKNNQMNSSMTEIYNIALDIHNKYRSQHGSKELALNLDLCEIAQKYAEQCSETNTIDHYCNLYNNEIIGQNIEVVENSQLNYSDICKKWYHEKDQYDFALNKFNSKARHFTQLIWRDSKYVGFGYSTSDDGKMYFVAYYYPAGNIFNKFSENVKK